MNQLSLVLAALLAGFVGGAVGGRVSYTGKIDANTVVRARSFELVNERGQTISFWGVDESESAVLAFAGRGLAPGAASGRDKHPGSHPENQLFAIGLLPEDSPMLKMRGTDGKTRLRMLLSSNDKPVLLMEDENGPRLSLGIEHSDTPGVSDNNWGLVFAQERARIGMGTEKERGQTYVRGVLSINQDRVKYE